MRNRAYLAAAAAAVLAFGLGGTAAPAGQVSAGVSVGPGGITSFHAAVGAHYRVSPQVVVDYKSRYKLPDDDLPVVFFIAARAQVGPGAVIDLRLGGRSWFEIAVRFGLSPDIFFVPVGSAKIGPPYGNAYGYYRNRGRAGDWRDFRPNDREVVDLVNLRFMSEYHGHAPEEIIAMRSGGKSFAAIHEGLGKGQSKAAPGQEPKSQAKGKGKKK